MDTLSLRFSDDNFCPVPLGSSLSLIAISLSQFYLLQEQIQTNRPNLNKMSNIENRLTTILDFLINLINGFLDPYGLLISFVVVLSL